MKKKTERVGGKNGEIGGGEERAHTQKIDKKKKSKIRYSVLMETDFST